MGTQDPAVLSPLRPPSSQSARSRQETQQLVPNQRIGTRCNTQQSSPKMWKHQKIQHPSTCSKQLGCPAPTARSARRCLEKPRWVLSCTKGRESRPAKDRQQPLAPFLVSLSPLPLVGGPNSLLGNSSSSLLFCQCWLDLDVGLMLWRLVSPTETLPCPAAMAARAVRCFGSKRRKTIPKHSMHLILLPSPHRPAQPWAQEMLSRHQLMSPTANWAAPQQAGGTAALTLCQCHSLH